MEVVPSQLACYTLTPSAPYEFVRASSLFDLGDRPAELMTDQCAVRGAASGRALHINTTST